MSGGSLDYAYQKVQEAFKAIIGRNESPLHRAFALHLEKVAKALHDIEWVYSLDYGKGDADDAIRAVLGEPPAIPESELKLEYRNAVIAGAKIHVSNRGVPTALVTLNYGDTGYQGFGNFVLYSPSQFKSGPDRNYAGHFIYRTMQVAGVSSWDEMIGRAVRVRSGFSGVRSIGHIIKSDWFCPAEDFGADK